MSVSLETLAHLFSIHGDDMSPDGRRQVAEAIESGESFIIVPPVFAPPKAFPLRLARLSEADWTALLGFEPQNNPAFEGMPGKTFSDVDSARRNPKSPEGELGERP